MNLKINQTADGVKQYPIHKHTNYEIMLYLEGNGYLKSTHKDYPFRPGSIIIVPPGILHGSVSENGFKNISISGDFNGLMGFSEIVTLSDNERNEATNLAKIIYDNRSGNKKYLSQLCLSYVHCILLRMNFEDDIYKTVNLITSGVMNNFSNPDFKVSTLLSDSGYAEDYIRAQFKKITGKTPGSFVTDVRIKHALFLIDIYSNTLSLEQVAEKCGYDDYIYFSKKFKSIIGKSPREYKNSLLGKPKN